GALNAKIPLVNVSVNDLLNFADQLAEALDNAKNNPAGTLQLLDAKISEAFGVDPASDLLKFGLDDFGTPLDRSDDIIKLELNLHTGFSKSLNVQMPDVQAGEFGGFGGAATLGAAGAADLKLHLGIKLNAPTQVFLYSTSGLTGTLTLSGTNLAFRAALGPVGLFINDGEASIVGAIGAG